MSGLKYTIKNLGPIKDATIETGKLTVFTGHNHTGKTWAMNLMYGGLYFRTLPDEYINVPFEQFIRNKLSQLLEVDHVAIYSSEIKKMIMEYVSSIGNYQIKNFKEIFATRQKIVGNATIVNNFEELTIDFTFLSDAFLSKIIKYIPYNLALKKIEHGTDSYIDISIKSLENYNDEIKSKDRSFEDNIFIHNQKQEFIKFFEMIKKTPQDLKKELGGSMDVFEKTMLMLIKNSITLNTNFYFHFIPAGRSGFHLTYLDLDRRNSDLVRQIKLNDDEESRKRFDEMVVAQYPFATERYLQFLGTARNIEGNIEGNYFQDYITKRIVKMDYSVDSMGVVRGRPHGTDQPYPIHMLSSAANNLYGLWLALIPAIDYIQSSKENLILFIDEPELNLHPENQQMVARLLVQLVNSGIHIVISTHSDYIITELNTMIMLSREFPERAEIEAEYGFDKDGRERLNPEDVKAYHFTMEGVEPCKINLPGGIVVPSMEKVIKRMNESYEWACNSYEDSLDNNQRD
ncbi:MAG: AAA family ATPase [Candidatus Pacebacteria bacterium]|nr:AAA family ATPase [Candidatus Paceibacterota bacterium]